MKKVCFVLHTDLFFPWPVARAVKEIDVLKELGYEIHAVCWIKGTRKFPEDELKDGVHIHRVFMTPPNGAISRFLAYKKILSQMAQRIIEINPHAIICHDLEILKAGVLAKKKLGTLLFFDAHENWPEMVAQNSQLESRYFFKLENKLLKHVTHTYTYGDDLTDRYSSMGFPSTTLYNSKSVLDIPKLDENEIDLIREKLGINKNEFVVGFSGSASLRNGAQQVIDALFILHKNFVFLVVGGSVKGEDLEGIRRHAKKNKVGDKVIITGRMPPNELLRYTAVMDVGTALFQPRSENEKVRIPNKIFDYMAMEVPMIVADFPNMRNIVVDEAQCGIAVNPMDLREVTKAILHFQENPKGALEIGSNGRRKFEELYSWDVQKRKLTDSHPFWKEKSH